LDAEGSDCRGRRPGPHFFEVILGPAGDRFDAPCLAVLAIVSQLKDAALELRLQQGSQGRTVLRVERQDSPLRVLLAFETPSSEALAHILNNGGGLLTGDRYSIRCAVEAGAAAQVTTAGATPIYRGKPGAVQTTEFCLVRARCSDICRMR